MRGHTTIMRGKTTEHTTGPESFGSLRFPATTSASDEPALSERRADWVAPEPFRSDAASGEITTCVRHTEIVRQTCEFLRRREPHLYKELWEELQKRKPAHENPLLETRQVRDSVPPDAGVAECSPTAAPHSTVKKELRATPYSLALPRIDKKHWAYARHAQVGHYARPRDKAEEQAAIREEGRLDKAVINSYLQAYRDLGEDLSGKNLWRATRHPEDRSPYYTTMEIVKQEANPPEHFYALIHYGMGLHMLYELSLARTSENAPPAMAKLTGLLQQSFKAIAKAYRQDFCQEDSR